MTKPLTRWATLSLAISSIILISFVIYKDILNYTFIGSDAINFVYKGRIKSIEDIIRIFSEAVFDGTAFQNFGRFYRPILALSYGLDYSIWRLNPFGYHLTDLILHIAVSVLVFFFALSLTNGKQVVSWLSAAIFTIHPIHINILPLTASSRQESTFTIFVILTFLTFFKYRRTLPLKSRYLFLSLLFYLLALGFKESAVIFLPLILIYLMIFHYSSEKSLKDNLLMATKQCAPLIIATLIYLAWRTYVLKGLGGYFIHNSAVVTSVNPSGYNVLIYLQVMKNIIVSYFKYLLFPVDFLKSHDFISFSKLIEQVILLFLVLSVPLSLLLYKLSIITKLRLYKDELIKSHNIKLIFFLIVWILLPISLLLVAKAFSTRYLYSSVIPLSIILSVLGVKVIQTAARKIRESVYSGSKYRLFINISLSGFIFVSLLGSFIVYSPIVRGIDNSWGNINNMNEIFFHKFMEVIADMPEGSRIHLHHVPQIGLHTYTLQSWLNLTCPSKNITVDVVRSGQKRVNSFRDLWFEIENKKGRDINMNIIYADRKR